VSDFQLKGMSQKSRVISMHFAVETCAIGIGMSERNTYELFPFQFENTVLEFVGNQVRRIDLSGKAWFPI